MVANSYASSRQYRFILFIVTAIGSFSTGTGTGTFASRNAYPVWQRKLVLTNPSVWHHHLLPEDSGLEQNRKFPQKDSDRSRSHPLLSLRGGDVTQQLADAYNLQTSSSQLLLEGSLRDALRQARSNGRLLVVLIPSQKSTSENQPALTSLLSRPVQKVAQRAIPASGDKTLTSGSFFLWACIGDAAEATAARKLLAKALASTQQPETTRPLLLIVHSSPTGTPQILVKHHCRPPPSSVGMASWMKLLRKRSLKLYRSMARSIAEAAIAQERQSGFQASMQQDQERQAREREELAQRQAAKAAQEAKEQELRERRVQLASNLPVEPDDDQNARIIRLDYEGQTAQRRFGSDATLLDVWNWMDVTYELERERVVLTTLREKYHFEQNCKTSVQALKRMTAFRVILEEEQAADSSENDNNVNESDEKASLEEDDDDGDEEEYDENYIDSEEEEEEESDDEL